MNTTLYFLRSSEQQIISDMLYYAFRLDELQKSLSDIPKLSIYNEFYGFTNKDLGLYALVDHKIAGAVWIRRLNEDHAPNGFVDDKTPILNMAVVPEFRGQGIGTMMLEQLIVEAGALYDSISVSVRKNSRALSFYERSGFMFYDNGFAEKSFVDGSDVITMFKKLPNGPVVRPTDGYDPRRWMD